MTGWICGVKGKGTSVTCPPFNTSATLEAGSLRRGGNYWKATWKGVLTGIWDSEVHALPVTPNYTSIMRDYWVQGSMLGDMTFRKIFSLGGFSLV